LDSILAKALHVDPVPQNTELSLQMMLERIARAKTKQAEKKELPG
jgi:hypothetical protein